MLALHFERSTEIDPFRKWVPLWLKVVVAFIILFPILLINGAYTGSNIDISGALGVMSEDINMAYYAASAGMAVAHLVIPKVKPIATAKTIILVVLLCQVVLSFICATTSYIEVLVACSFFIGYFKAFSLVEVIGVLMPVMSPSETRNEFYSKFYPITLGCGQLSLVLTGQLAYLYNWQYMYYFMILLLLVAVLAVLGSMTYARRLLRIPVKDIDWISLVLISTCYLCFIYVVTYGKINDWFTSPYILGAAVTIPYTGWMFLRRQFTDKKMTDLSLLKNRSSAMAYTLSFALMFFVSFSILISTYTSTILNLGSARMTQLYLYMLPGFVVGGIISYYAYLRETRMMWLMFIGFACFTLSMIILYFKVSPTGLYSDLYLPMFLRGVGMLVLFVALAIYAIYGLSQDQLGFNSFYMISFRSALAPALGASVLSNWLYRTQAVHRSRLTEGLDIQNTTALNQFNEAVSKSMAQGWSVEDAQRIAMQSLYSKIDAQATLISIKEILGWMIVIGIVLLVIILLYFFQFKPVKLMRTGRDISG